MESILKATNENTTWKHKPTSNNNWVITKLHQTSDESYNLQPRWVFSFFSLFVCITDSKTPCGPLFSLIFASRLSGEVIPDNVHDEAAGSRTNPARRDLRAKGKAVVWIWRKRVIRRPACCQSSTNRWQRPEERTWGSCSPEWRCLRPLCRTAWRCSQLECREAGGRQWGVWINAECLTCAEKKKQKGTLTVVVMDYLKVFDWSLGNAAVEVQHVRLSVVVPHGRLVVQLDQVVQRVTLPPAQEALLILWHRNTHQSLNVTCTENSHVKFTSFWEHQTHILRPDWYSFKIHVHARDDYSHLTWPFEAQHVGFLTHSTHSTQSVSVSLNIFNGLTDCCVNMRLFLSLT